MIHEAHTDPFILGAIDAWGDVFYKIAYDDQAQHPQEWRAYKTWRYIPDIGLLMWWETPDEGEKMTVEDWLERKGYEVKLRSVMGQKLRIREVIKSLKGTPLKRYKNKVGKLVGPQLYVHRQYAAEVIPHSQLKYAAEMLKQIKPTFRFNSVMWNRDTNEIRFDEAPDFDTAREPHVGKFIAISPDGSIREGQSNNIWHHKWLWVKDDYPGFDVNKSKEWSDIWISRLGQKAKGTDASFRDQLKQVGLAELIKEPPIKENLDDVEDYRKALYDYMDEQFPKEFDPRQQLMFGLTMDDLKKAMVDKVLATPIRSYHTEDAPHGVFSAKDNEIELYFDFNKQNSNPRYDAYVRSMLFHEFVHALNFAKKLWDRVTYDALMMGKSYYSDPEEKRAYRAQIRNYLARYLGLGRKKAETLMNRFSSDQSQDRKDWIPRYFDLIEPSESTTLKELLMNEGNRETAALKWLMQMVQKGPFRGKVYLAGGAVRDMEMGKDPKDLDVVVVGDGINGGIAFCTWLAQQMGNYKAGSNPVVFPAFGTAKVALTGEYEGISLDGIDVEAVASRKEQYTKGSRKPEVVPGSLEDDVFRRDFTVNSLVMDLTTGKILDLSGKGLADIRAGIIRTTSDPDIIFGQDALRMFRAIRFATKYNWQLAPELVAGIKKNLDNLGNTSRERIRDEINKILQTGNPKRGFELLRDTGLLPYVAPEFQQAVGMTQNVHHTQDVFDHTMSVLQATKPELITRLMALFHDIGKVATRSETPTGVHFYGHEDAGAEVAEKIMRDLKYPTELIQAVKLGVKNHMRLKQGGDDAVKLSDKALRKFKIELGDQLENILDVIHADNTAHADASAMPNQIENVRKRLQNLEVTVKKPTLPINGNDLIAMGVKQGPMIGKILAAVTEKWFENPNITREEAFAIARSML